MAFLGVDMLSPTLVLRTFTRAVVTNGTYKWVCPVWEHALLAVTTLLPIENRQGVLDIEGIGAFPALVALLAVISSIGPLDSDLILALSAHFDGE